MGNAKACASYDRTAALVMAMAQHFRKPMQPVIPASLGLDLCNRG